MRWCVWLVVAAAPSFASGGEKPAVILKHDGWVAAVAFSPDGKTLASAGADNVVRLWEVGTWKPKGVLKGHTDCVTAVAFSPDSTTLGTGSFDRTAKLWDVGKQKHLATFAKHQAAIGAVLVIGSQEKPGIVTGGLDGSIRTELPPSDSLATLRHKSWVNGLSRELLVGYASASSDGTVVLHGADGIVSTFEGGAGEVRCVAFNPGGKLLAAGNRYHTVRVWEVASKKEIKTLGGHMSDVWSIAFSPDGKTLAAADTDWKKASKVKLWDTTTWKERGGLEVPGEILSIAYSPKGDWLAVGSWDKTVRVFAIAR